MEIRSFVQAGTEVLTGGNARGRLAVGEGLLNLEKKSNAVNYATDMFVKRHWIIIISVVLMVLDFAVSSLRWKYLQFGWRTVQCCVLVYDVDQLGCMAELCCASVEF